MKHHYDGVLEYGMRSLGGGRRSKTAVLAAAACAALLGSTCFATVPVPAWEQRLEGSRIPDIALRPIAIRQLADGSTMVVFRSYDLNVVRYGPNGSILSTARIPSLADRVAIDAFGAVGVLYSSVPYGPHSDIAVMRYDGATGKATWKAPARFVGADDANDLAGEIATAPNGDLIVTGFSGVFSVSARLVVIRYDWKTGAARWTTLSDLEIQAVWSYDVAVDPFGDVIVAATGSLSGESSSSGWMVFKYSGDSGLRMWRTEPVGVPYIEMVCPGSCFLPFGGHLAVDAQGNVFLAATSFLNRNEEWLILKYEGGTGRRVWGPVPFNGGGEGYEAPEAIVVDARGDVFVAGSANRPGNTPDLAILKLAGATGNVDWGPVFLVPAGLGGVRFVLDGFGNPILVGSSSTTATTEWRALKLSSHGNLLWQKALLTRTRSAVAELPGVLAVTSDGSIVVAGSSWEESRAHGLTLTFNGFTGSTLWGPVSFDGLRRATSDPGSMVTDSRGDLIITAGDFDSSGYSNPKAWIQKRDRESGALLWGPVPLSSAEGSIEGAIAVDSKDDVFATLLAYSRGGASRWEIVKHEGSTGRLLWGPLLNDSSYNHPVHIAVDSRDDLFVIGETGSGLSSTWALFKYDGGSGALLWGPVVYEPPLYDNARIGQAVQLAMDHEGDVVVVSVDKTGYERWVWATVKYDGESGAPIWGPIRLEVSSNAIPFSLGVDSTDNVVVTGVAFASGATIKYSGDTGLVLWGPILTGSKFTPRKLALDGHDDVFLLGIQTGIRNGIQTAQMATGKLSGVDGTMLWGPVIGPPSANPYTSALTLDDAGNPIALAASSSTLGFDDDWLTIKYYGSDGKTLWGPLVYDGGERESPTGIAVSRNDFVVLGRQSSMTLIVRYTEALNIRTLPHDVDAAHCSEDHAQSFQAENGVQPYSWLVVDGTLPSGLTLLASGELSGTADKEGEFAFTVRVTDATGSHAERAFTIDVFEGGERPVVHMTPAPICPDGYSLGLDETFASYSWLPDGQTTAAIEVCPEQPSLYGVVATDERGCPHRASVELSPGPIPARQPIVRPVRSRPPAIPRNR